MDDNQGVQVLVQPRENQFDDSLCVCCCGCCCKLFIRSSSIKCHAIEVQPCAGSCLQSKRNYFHKPWGLQFSPCYLVQPQEDGERFIHCETAYELYLEMLAVVSKMWKSHHCWVSHLYLVQGHHLLLGGLCSTPSYTFQVSIKCWFEQQNERTYSLLVAVQIPFHPMHMRMLQTMEISWELISAVTIENYSSGSSVVYPGSVHERTVQYNAVTSKDFNSNIFLCFGIYWVGNFTCLQVFHVWQYLPDGPGSPLWPPNSQENTGKTVRKEISCRGILTTISGSLIHLKFAPLD